MGFWRIIILACAASIFVDAKWYHHQKRETSSNICDPVYNNTNKVQCYCIKDTRDPETLRSADCYLINENVKPDDNSWIAFQTLKNANKLTLTNTRGIILKYVPTNAFKQMTSLTKLDIKYANIEKIEPYAFANLSVVEEITLSDNQIKILETHSFAHLKNLTTIGLDTNNIIEINRDVFVDLPSLQKLFLTSNKITTIHDRAFIYLTNLGELEIDRNGLFSLNSETFSGLKKLHKLDLSSNSLEVIGDNTFLPLINLKSLNLESNKIQMLDEKAFNGLSNLQSLSLAHNKLIEIDNVKIFEGLDSLILLSLRGNQIRELKTEVMAPILSNLYGNASSLDVEDNNFPCDCRLDWFMSLMNKTQNSHLKLAIENLKCYPDASLREAWTKTEETDKSGTQVFENEESQVQSTDYEYYDETQLNGKLFYIDVRDLLHCSHTKGKQVTSITEHTDFTPAKATQMSSSLDTSTNELSTTASSKILSTLKPASSTEHIISEVSNRRLLDSSLVDTNTSPETVETTKGNDVSSEHRVTKMKEKEVSNENNLFTTTRLATVSAKPVEHNMYGDNVMASDEAKPDKIKAHRSIQDNIKDTPNFNNNIANRNISGATVLLSLIICLRLCF